MKEMYTQFFLPYTGPIFPLPLFLSFLRPPLQFIRSKGELDLNHQKLLKREIPSQRMGFGSGRFPKVVHGSHQLFMALG